MIELRPYQEEIIAAVFAGWQKYTDVLAVAGVGAGKTNILWEIVNRFLMRKSDARIVILAHRKELIEQPFDRLRQFWPHLLPLAGIVMGGQNDSNRQIIVATVQTLGSASGRRMAEVLSHGAIDMLIIDECHHANEAKTYRNTIERLKAVNPALLHLGVTATPSGKTLAEVYQAEVANVGVKKLIDDGFLCPPEIYGVQTNINLSGVTVQGSGGNRDYNQGQLVSAVESSNCFELVIKTHMERVGERPAIAFVPSVNSAYDLARGLQERGISAIAADGETPKDVRAGILADFKNGRYTCLVNVALWTEGLDLPNLEYCHLVRPTKSDALYLQMIGRVLRLHPGKEKATIFDYKPAGERDLNLRLERLQLKKEGEQWTPPGGGAEKAVPRSDGSAKYITLDYFNKSRKNWLTDDSGWRIIAFGAGDDGIDRSLAVSPETGELWLTWKRDGERWHSAHRHQAATTAQVLAAIDEYTAKYAGRHMDRSASWRQRPPSEGQAKFARNLGIALDGLNMGQVSDAINKKLTLQAVERARRKMAD